MSKVNAFDPNFGWEPVVPLPFYKWRWFRWIYLCWECDTEFKKELDYQSHYLRVHSNLDPEEHPVTGTGRDKSMKVKWVGGPRDGHIEEVPKGQDYIDLVEPLTQRADVDAPPLPPRWRVPILDGQALWSEREPLL